MIGYLRGSLREREAGRVVLDVGGVGYVVHVPMSTFLELPAEGEQVALFVNTQVREDAITLYGFRERPEQDVFERLLSVSGVGPRMALAALSAMGPADLVSAIREADVRKLSGVPGIGKKTAERLIVDLRDRLGAAGKARGTRPPGVDAGDVVSALVNLGYPERQAARAVGELLETPAAERPKGFDALLREALKRLSRSA